MSLYRVQLRITGEAIVEAPSLREAHRLARLRLSGRSVPISAVTVPCIDIEGPLTIYGPTSVNTVEIMPPEASR